LERFRTLAKRVPGAHTAYDAALRARHEVRATVYAVRGWLRYRLPQRRTAGRRLSRQAALSTSLPLSASSANDVADLLQRAGLRFELFEQGLYAPPQAGLAEVVGVAASTYPPTAGLRVVSFDPRGRTLADAAREAAIVGNFLHQCALGPRIYDVLTEADGSAETAGTGLAAFAVEHVGDAPPPHEKLTMVTRAIEARLDSGELDVADERWRDASNFRGTADDSGSARFVAFERLCEPQRHGRLKAVLESGAREHLHFGRELASRGGRYLYQSVPSIGATGRRDSLARWELISQALARNGASPTSRLVLDIGCNAGMMLGAALADGASWGLGWDRPEVAGRGRALLWAMGYTRFDLTGGDLHPGYPLLDDVPFRLRPQLEGALVLYLAVHHHVGFLAALAEFPWKAMVFEGAETDHVDTLGQTLHPLMALCEIETVWAENFRDSETLSRPVAILRRK
jgi:hypothetical protein